MKTSSSSQGGDKIYFVPDYCAVQLLLEFIFSGVRLRFATCVPLMRATQQLADTGRHLARDLKRRGVDNV